MTGKDLEPSGGSRLRGTSGRALRVIIAGSRHVTQQQAMAAIRGSGLETWGITEVVSGGQSTWDWRIQAHRGADYWGEKWAAALGIKVVRFPAQWAKYGRSAGPKRNAVMAENADALFAIWDGKSRGTQNMIEEARTHGLRVVVHLIPGAAEGEALPEPSSAKGSAPPLDPNPPEKTP